MWILVWICDANVSEFDVEELINRMQRTTYTIQAQMMTSFIQYLMWSATVISPINYQQPATMATKGAEN